MKAIAGVLGLLLTLGVVALLVKKQLPGAAPVHTTAQPSEAAATTTATATTATPQQVKQQVEAIMQQPRSNPEDK